MGATDHIDGVVGDDHFHTARFFDLSKGITSQEVERTGRDRRVLIMVTLCAVLSVWVMGDRQIGVGHELVNSKTLP